MRILFWHYSLDFASKTMTCSGLNTTYLGANCKIAGNCRKPKQNVQSKQNFASWDITSDARALLCDDGQKF